MTTIVRPVTSFADVLSACIDSHGLAKNRPAHHTEDGFQNNYLPLRG